MSRYENIWEGKNLKVGVRNTHNISGPGARETAASTGFTKAEDGNDFSALRREPDP